MSISDDQSEASQSLGGEPPAPEPEVIDLPPAVVGSLLPCAQRSLENFAKNAIEIVKAGTSPAAPMVIIQVFNFSNARIVMSTDNKNEFKGPVSAGVIGEVQSVQGDISGMKISLSPQTLAELPPALNQLIAAMLQSAGTDADRLMAVGKVAEAKKAAEAGDAGGVASALKVAGKWALEIAEKIGVKVASEAIAAALGIAKLQNAKGARLRKPGAQINQRISGVSAGWRSPTRRPWRGLLRPVGCR